MEIPSRPSQGDRCTRGQPRPAAQPLAALGRAPLARLAARTRAHFRPQTPHLTARPLRSYHVVQSDTATPVGTSIAVTCLDRDRHTAVVLSDSGHYYRTFGGPDARGRALRGTVMTLRRGNGRPLADQPRKVASRDITRSIESMLWGRAAGRCEFQGCNQELYKSRVTQEPVNIAEKAHIYAFSSAGPARQYASRPRIAQRHRESHARVRSVPYHD